MKVLYVVGTCLSKNTSANMSHNGYVQGLLENGCQVDIIMATDSWGQEDAFLPTWENARYFCYPSETLHDKLRKRVSGEILKPVISNMDTDSGKKTNAQSNVITALKLHLRKGAKNAFYACFPTDPKYPLEKQWLKNATKFAADEEYDLVISNSSPAASHKLVAILTQNGHLKYKRWVQIWEDPWYYDLYGNHSKEIFDEESSLLRSASEVLYVSPLTLIYQQQHFKDCAYKMSQIPLPYLTLPTGNEQLIGQVSFAYLGDYYSHVRNIVPFYQALCKSGVNGYIYGDSDLKLEKTDTIEINGRVTLDRLAAVQERAAVLVHLCNLYGGQIPGKIYHYSATKKPILFILDGTSQEKAYIKNYFEVFNRYYFCDNDVQSIQSAMEKIKLDIEDGKKWGAVTAFSPKSVVAQLL